MAAQRSRTHVRRSWLTPVADAALWPIELNALPMPAWPMTHHGLAHAVKNLAGIDAKPSAPVRLN